MVTTERRKWLALALLSAVQFMVVLDIAVVNVALPSIQVDLGFSQENLQWVISAYALVFGGLLLLGGRSADLLGRRRIFLVGVVVFTAASLLAGLAWSEPSLIGARALQGLGAAIISPAALSILSTTFAEGRERNIALGVWGAVGGFGAAAGVMLGGVLTEALSWEWIFFVNVPVGVAAFVLAPLLLAESRDANVQKFDAPGAVLVTVGLSSLVYAITQAGQDGWLGRDAGGLRRDRGGAARRVRGVGAAATRATDAFRHPADPDRERRERGRPHPRHRAVLDVPDADPLHAAGARLLADAHRCRVPRGGRHGDRLVDRGCAARHPGGRQAGPHRRDGEPDGRPRCTSPRSRSTARTSATCCPASCWPGSGSASPSCRSRSLRLRASEPAEAGLASGLFNTSQQIGGALGIAALSTIATSRSDDAVAAGTALPVALVDGFTAAFTAGAVVAALGIIAALTLIRREELEQAAEPEPALEMAA